MGEGERRWTQVKGQRSGGGVAHALGSTRPRGSAPQPARHRHPPQRLTQPRQGGGPEKPRAHRPPHAKAASCTPDETHVEAQQQGKVQPRTPRRNVHDNRCCRGPPRTARGAAPSRNLLLPFQRFLRGRSAPTVMLFFSPSRQRGARQRKRAVPGTRHRTLGLSVAAVPSLSARNEPFFHTETKQNKRERKKRREGGGERGKKTLPCWERKRRKRNRGALRLFSSVRSTAHSNRQREKKVEAKRKKSC